MDIATTTGWCVLDGDRYTVGHFDVKPKSKDEPEGVRYYRMMEHTERLLDAYPQVRAVGLEQPFTQRRRTATLLGGLAAAVLIVLTRRDLEYVFIHPTSLKAWAARRGAAQVKDRRGDVILKSKDAMREAAVEALGRDVTHDEADAYWLVRFVAHEYVVQVAG